MSSLWLSKATLVWLLPIDIVLWILCLCCCRPYFHNDTMLFTLLNKKMRLRRISRQGPLVLSKNVQSNSLTICWLWEFAKNYKQLTSSLIVSTYKIAILRTILQRTMISNDPFHECLGRYWLICMTNPRIPLIIKVPGCLLPMLAAGCRLTSSNLRLLMASSRKVMATMIIIRRHFNSHSPFKDLIS